MGYIKAEDILPRELLQQVQQYVDGENLYIPRKAENRQEWGCGTTYRAELAERNCRICADRQAGMTVPELADKYHLSEKSIGRILRQLNP